MTIRFSVTSLALPVMALTMALGGASLFTSADSTASVAQETPVVVAARIFDNRN